MRKIKLLVKLCFLPLVFCHCRDTSDDKIACNEAVQNNLQKEKIYSEVIRTAAKSLNDLKNKDGRIVYKDSSLIDSAVLDKHIFFNRAKNKCLLLVLQQTNADFKNDEILIVQGTLINNLWAFSYDRLPEVPEVIYTVKKHVKNKDQMNNTFEHLSISGRKFVLTAGNPAEGICAIDEQYWFGN